MTRTEPKQAPLSYNERTDQIMGRFVERLKYCMDRYAYGEMQKMCERAGVHYTTLMNYRKGRSQPSLGNLVRMADEFGVSLDWLCGLSEMMRPNGK